MFKYLGLLVLVGCATVPTEAPLDQALLVVDSALAADPDLDRELRHYVALVRRTFAYDVHIQLEPNDIAPEALRALLNQDSIRGAFLVGNFRMKKFKGAAGDECMFPEYFQDFDGEMRDDNRDGVLDFYDPWTGQNWAPALKIWLALLRPYEGVRDLVAYFAKVNAAMEQEGAASAGDAAIFTTHDWADQSQLASALKKRFRSVTTVGGLSPESGAPIATSPDDFGQAASLNSEILFVFAHSGPSVHALDRPAAPKNLIVAGKMDRFQINARVVALWGCHGLDVGDVRGPSLGNSYVMNPKNPTQTIVGAARSIGLEKLECFPDMMGDRPFCESWLKYQNSLYAADYLPNRFPSEKCRFNWSYVLYGNPFVRLRTLKTPASTLRTS